MAYELGEQAETVVYQDQKEVLHLTLTRQGEKIYCKAEGSYGYRIRFVNQILTRADGAELSIDGKDTVATVAEPQREVIVYQESV